MPDGRATSNRVTFDVMRRDAPGDTPARVLGSLNYAEAMDLVEELRAKAEPGAWYWMRRVRT